jgi:hypothetical protein
MDDLDDFAGDVLQGAGEIRAYLRKRGMRETTNPYRLRKQGWPIGSTGQGGSLFSTKRKLDRHIDKMTRGSTAAILLAAFILLA